MTSPLRVSMSALILVWNRLKSDGDRLISTLRCSVVGRLCTSPGACAHPHEPYRILPSLLRSNIIHPRTVFHDSDAFIALHARCGTHSTPPRLVWWNVINKMTRRAYNTPQVFSLREGLPASPALFCWSRWLSSKPPSWRRRCRKTRAPAPSGTGQPEPGPACD